MSFLKFIINIMFTAGFSILFFIISVSFFSEFINLRDYQSYGITWVLMLIIVPVIVFLSRKLTALLFGGNSYQEKIEKLQREVEAKRKIMELESKLEAQERVNDLHKDIKKKFK